MKMDSKIVLAILTICANAALSIPVESNEQNINSIARNPCVCARHFAPVCGSDGKTYSNSCVLNCFNSEEGKSVTIASTGRCKQEGCICTYEYKPVCANDGKTYPNRCSMLCKRSENPEIDVVSEGVCSNEVKVPEPPCICTMELNEVCGSDGNTYGNPCTLNCATANDPGLKIEHAGRCSSKVKIAEPVTPSKVQVVVVTPDSSNVQVAEPEGSNVQPEQLRPALPLCVCGRNLELVCGSDGKTYGNPCMLGCAGKDIRIARYGQC